LMNYATFYEARAASPSFRPRFKWFDLRLSLLGFLACLITMMAIDLKTGIIAVSILFAIYQYLKRTAGPSRWADSRRAYYLQRIRENIFAASAEPEHPRDWRPQILAFSNDPERRSRLLRFASWIEGRSGITTVVRILEGTGAKIYKDRLNGENELRRDIQESGVSAFPLVMVTPEIEAGLNSLLQGFGIGPVKANTILSNWLNPEASDLHGFRKYLFGRHLRTVHRLGCNIVILYTDEKRWTALMERSAGTNRIDVWWRGDATSRLMLLFAYLMTRSEPWDEAAIRVLAINYENDSPENIEDLADTLNEVRIEAEPKIIPEADIQKITEISTDASMVFLPFRFWDNQIIGPVDVRVEELLPRLPTAALVLAAEDIDLQAEPEAGTAGEMAAARDAQDDADKKAREAQKDAENALRVAEGAKEKIRVFDETRASDDKPEELTRLEAGAKKAEMESEKAYRRAAKAEAKAQDAAKNAADLGVEADTDDRQ